MNELFVSVKVDREERPDVDGLYMDAVVAMTGHGGWPMTVFLTPDGRPFYGGTYFPPEPGTACPSFRQVLQAVAEAYRTRRDDLEQQADVLVDAIRPGERAAALDRAADHRAPERRRPGARCAASTRREGGFGGAPEVPGRLDASSSSSAGTQPTGDEDALGHGAATLDRMAAGGHLRPARRRVPPLLRGRALARPALREDALRQRAPRLGLPAGWAVTGRSATGASRRRRWTTSFGSSGSPRAGSPRPRTRTRTASRASPSPGRRKSSRPCWASRRRVAPPVRARALDPPRRAARGRAAPRCSPSASAGRSRSATTRRWPPGTGSRSRPSRRRGRGSTGRLPGRGGRRRGVPPRPALGRTRSAPALLPGRRGAHTRLPRGLRQRRQRPAGALLGDRRPTLARGVRTASPASSWSSSPIRCAAAFTWTHRRATASSRGARSSTTTPLPPGTRWPPSSSSGLRGSTATTTWRGKRSASSGSPSR